MQIIWEANPKMAEFKTSYGIDDIHEIIIIGNFQEDDTEYLAALLEDIYNPDEAKYVYIDFSQHHILPLRALGSTILRFYRDRVHQTPIFIALVVQPSLGRVLNSVIKTLMHRELVQIFTDANRAYQWLELEREKQS